MYMYKNRVTINFQLICTYGFYFCGKNVDDDDKPLVCKGNNMDIQI